MTCLHLTPPSHLLAILTFLSSFYYSIKPHFCLLWDLFSLQWAEHLLLCLPHFSTTTFSISASTAHGYFQNLPFNLPPSSLHLMAGWVAY